MVTAVGAEVTKLQGRRPRRRRLHGRLLPRVRAAAAPASSSTASRRDVVTYNGIEQGRRSPPTAATRTQHRRRRGLRAAHPDGLRLDGAAPLLCAGITTYSPLRHWNAGPGDRGRRGRPRRAGPHGASSWPRRMGAEVTVLSPVAGEEGGRPAPGRRAATTPPPTTAPSRSCAAASTSSSTPSRRHHDLDRYLRLLRARRHDGQLGVPRRPAAGRRRSRSSAAPQPRRLAHRRHRRDPGDARLLRRARHRLRHRGDRIRKINEAYERVIDSDVRYRFVIDTESLR